MSAQSSDRIFNLWASKAVLPAQTERLKERESVIVVPGAIRSEPDALPVGGSWILRAASKSDVEAFLYRAILVQALRQDYGILFSASPRSRGDGLITLSLHFGN